LGTISGTIVGSFFTYYVGIRKQKPIDERIKELILYELQGYRDLLPHSADALIEPDSYKISLHDVEEMLKKFKISYYRRMQDERKIEVFRNSYQSVELAYIELLNYMDELEKEFARKHPLFILVSKKKSDNSYQIIINAIASLQSKKRYKFF